jgi:putative zinc finger protein
MDCDLFLDGYSDFRDGMLPAAEAAGFHAHLDECASCARYDRVLGEGVKRLVEQEPLRVSEDFMARLQHRIYNEDEARSPLAGRSRAGAGAVAGTLAAAAVVGAVALTPLADRPERVAADVAPLSGSRADAGEIAAEARDASTGLGARLEQVGVQVYPMPYRDVLYRTASVASSAGHEAGAGAAEGR